MKKTLVLTLLVVLCSLGAQSLLWGQSSFTVPIYVDNGTDKETLWVGVDPSGTYGIDAGLGEQELPPTPPDGVFDARLVDTRSPGSLGQGLSKDVHAYGSDCQNDTFKIKFQPSTEGGSDVTFSWSAATLGANGCGRWRLSTSMSDPDIAVDMLEDETATINSEEYTNVYILKGDGAEYRTFSMLTLVHDGIYDAKGIKKTYGKPVKRTSNQVEFCITLTNQTSSPQDTLKVEFKTPVDSTTVTVDAFSSFKTDAKQKAGGKTKYYFTGGELDSGETVTICGYGVKTGTKAQVISSYAWLNGVGKVIGKAISGKTLVFSQNAVRLPMPNTVNAGEEAMIQGLPLKTDLLIVGTTARTDTLKYVQHKKYADVLKTLIKDAGKVGKEKMQDSAASYLNNYDDKKKGLRTGKGIKGAQKTLAPDKHRNRLLGEALTLSVNILMSQTSKVPTGLGELVFNLPTSPLNGKSVDSLKKWANTFLSYGTLASAPSVTADDLADWCAMVNGAFDTDLDTLSFAVGAKVAFTGSALADAGGWLMRAPGVEPKIISDFTNSSVPVQYELQQNYPNPFNPTTTIKFTLPVEGLVTVKVFNLLGQEVATLANSTEFASGENEVVFDASSLSSGVYFYRIKVSDLSTSAVRFESLKKMVLLK